MAKGKRGSSSRGTRGKKGAAALRLLEEIVEASESGGLHAFGLFDWPQWIHNASQLLEEADDGE